MKNLLKYRKISGQSHIRLKIDIDLASFRAYVD